MEERYNEIPRFHFAEIYTVLYLNFGCVFRGSLFHIKCTAEKRVRKKNQKRNRTEAE